MASLQVRELPENIYSLLKRRDEAEHLCIAQEAIVLFSKRALYVNCSFRESCQVVKKSRRKLDK